VSAVNAKVYALHIGTHSVDIHNQVQDTPLQNTPFGVGSRFRCRFTKSVEVVNEKVYALHIGTHSVDIHTQVQDTPFASRTLGSV
jgi:hypothetical protein